MIEPYVPPPWMRIVIGVGVLGILAIVFHDEPKASQAPASAAEAPTALHPEQTVHVSHMTMGCMTRELEQTAGEHLANGEKSLALRMVDDGQCWLFDETTPLKVAHVEPGMSQVFVQYPSGREPVVWIPNKMLR